MSVRITSLSIIIVILVLYSIKSTLGINKCIDHPSYNENISSFCHSNPNSNICRHSKLKSVYKLADSNPFENHNLVQSESSRKILPPLPTSKNVEKRSAVEFTIGSSDDSPQKNLKNTEDNDWMSNKTTGTFQTFVNMFNRTPLDVPSDNIIEQNRSSNSIEIQSNSSSRNVDDANFMNIDSSSSFNEASENYNAANYYHSAHNTLDMESLRLSEQAKSIEEIVKRKLESNTIINSTTSNNRIVELGIENSPPDWVFSSGEAKNGMKVDMIPPSNFLDNKKPPDWIFSPPVSIVQYKSDSKIVDESENYSDELIAEGNISPLNNLEFEAKLVDNDNAAEDCKTQFNVGKNSVLVYNDEASNKENENKTHARAERQTFVSSPKESRIKGNKELHQKKEENMLILENLRHFLKNHFVSSDTNLVVTEKNKRRSVSNGRNIKNNDTKEALDHKIELNYTKFDYTTPSMIQTHSFSTEKTINLHSNSENFSIKSNGTNYMNKKSIHGSTDGNDTISTIRIKSEPFLTSKNLKQIEKSNQTFTFDKNSDLLRNLVRNRSEKPNYNAFKILVNNRDYPKISNVEGSSIEQLLKTNNDINKFNVSDESYVILRSKELQRMRNVLLDNFKQMIVNSNKKSDSSTCYYPWELSTLDGCSQTGSTPEGSTSSGLAISAGEGMELMTKNSLDGDPIPTISQDVDTTTRPQEDTFTPTTSNPQDNLQENPKLNQSSYYSSTETRIPSENKFPQDQNLSPSNDIDSSNNSGCQVEESFTEGLYFLVPAKGVNAIKCALENSRKIYMGSSITGKFIASIDTPSMVAQEKLLANEFLPPSPSFTVTNDTILRETIEHILRNKKNGEVELQQQGDFDEGANKVKGKEGEIITLTHR